MLNTSLHRTQFASLASGLSEQLCGFVFGSLSKIYKCISPTLQVDLSFDLIALKNLGHWFGLQTIARGIPTFVPLWDIVVSTFDRDPQDLLLVLLFVFVSCFS